MWSWTAEDLAAITGGVWEVLPPVGWVMEALAFTKKRLRRQALIIPKCRTYSYGVGREDLHDLIENGSALLVEGDIPVVPEKTPRLRVRSVRSAVANLAVSNRASFPGRVVAVTGSAGKSSTVSMIGDMLRPFGVPKRSTVNFNTFDGVNGEVANLRREAVAVVEVALSFLARNSIDNLRPDIAVITNVGEAHMEHYGSRQGIAAGKSNVFDLMRRGTAVVPRDSELYDYLVARAQKAGAVVVSFGVAPESDARLLSYSASSGLVEATILGERIAYKLGPRGQHMALNSVAALAAVSALGLDLRRAAGALAKSTEIAGRGAVFTVELGDRSFTVIDSAYNANPTSMRASLQMLSEHPVAGSGRRVAILADMLELGPQGEQFHVALADVILRLDIDRVHLVGPLMRSLWEVLPAEVRGCYLSGANGLWAVLEPDIVDGDLLLFKGSNGTNLHKVVAEAKNTSGPLDYSTSVPRKYAGIVMDAKSGKVLYESAPDAARYPASVTKVMTLYILFQELSAGHIEFSDEMMVSTHAASAAPSKLGLEAGSKITVENAIKALVTLSANDTARVIAEHISGSETEFAKRMTSTARALGMSRTTYINASGLQDIDHVTTVRDQAILGIAICQHFPKYYTYFQTKSFSYGERTYRNTNRLLGLDNIDGIKTGHTRSSGQNLLASARHGDQHIVVVCFGSDTVRARDADVRALVKKYLLVRADTDASTVAARALPGVKVPQPKTPEIRMVTAEESSRALASVVFVGDTSLGDAYLTSPRLSDELQRLEDDPWSFVELLAPLVEDKSLLIANLETVLAETPADPLGQRKRYQGWDRPDRTLSVLRRLQVDAVSLANNHTMDFGTAPLMATIAHLNSAGISAFGAGAEKLQAAKPLSYAAPFGNVHIFAGFEFRPNYARKYGFYASSAMPGVNPLSHGAAHFVADAIARTRANDPGSVIIVYPHWSGPANYGWANEEMVSLSEIFVSMGADLVIGHGAHRMQEVLSGSKGTTVFSLGNFVFNSPGRYRKFDAPPFSLVARLDLAQQGTGCAGSLRLYPIVSDNRVTSFRPRPVTESEASAVCASLRAREQSVGSFDKSFSLGQDRRGWFLEATTALSPRIARLPAVPLRALY